MNSATPLVSRPNQHEWRASLFGKKRATFTLISSILVLCAIFADFRFLSNLHEGFFLQVSNNDAQDVPTEPQNRMREGGAFLDASENRQSSSIFSVQDPSTSPPFAIFYNVYIPDKLDKEALGQTLAIVDDQMAQVGASYAASYKNKPVNVFFNTVGKRGVLNNEYMARVCSDRSNMRCMRMDHYDEGYEDLTLQRVYDYCQTHQEPGQQIIYMHNKGSFHPGGQNHWWRRHMTLAVTDKKCLNPANNTCNTCGLVFFGVWAMMYPGYIRKLIPPNRFNEKLEEMFVLRRKKNKENPFYSIISPNHSSLIEFGGGRYGPETWIASHPSMNPCDLTGETLNAWTRGPRDPADFSNAAFPRPPLKIDTRYLLAGNLFKWLTLYHEAPNDDSWAWRSFPDGEKWKQAVKIHGNQTVDVLMKEKWMREVNRTKSRNEKEKSLSRRWQRRTLNSSTANPVSATPINTSAVLTL